MKTRQGLQDGNDRDSHSDLVASNLVTAPKDPGDPGNGNNHHRFIGGGYFNFKRIL